MQRLYFSSVFFFLFFNPLYAANLNDLLPQERNTIEVFQKSAEKVVYVHRIANITKRHSDLHTQIPDGEGSGIIWDNQGHVVTNYHVIKDADELSVTINNKTLPVKVIGTEPRKDIAVLAISSSKALKELKPIIPFEMAKTTELLVGQKTIAIGNPFGLDHTLTVGVISALGRQVPGIGGVKIRDMIQTDASINPGNSGGPLLDSSGRLIGLNTAIFSQSGTSAGIGFAVPSDEITHIVAQIINNGHVKLAGIGIQQVEPTRARRFGVSSGILVSDVISNTPAAQAGLVGTHRDKWGRMQLGDIIVELNGHAIKDYDALYNLLSHMNIGETITVSVLRHDVPIQFKMKTIDIAAT